MANRKSRRKNERVGDVRRAMSAASGSSSKTYRVTLTGSEIGGTREQRATLRCLGLRRRGSSAVVADTPQSRGRIRAVAHLIAVADD